jgi:hypothetical protein
VFISGRIQSFIKCEQTMKWKGAITDRYPWFLSWSSLNSWILNSCCSYEPSKACHSWHGLPLFTTCQMWPHFNVSHFSELLGVHTSPCFSPHCTTHPQCCKLGRKARLAARLPAYDGQATIDIYIKKIKIR